LSAIFALTDCEVVTTDDNTYGAVTLYEIRFLMQAWRFPWDTDHFSDTPSIAHGTRSAFCAASDLPDPLVSGVAGRCCIGGSLFSSLIHDDVYGCDVPDYFTVQATMSCGS
jgi:hypothetical protein